MKYFNKIQLEQTKLIENHYSQNKKLSSLLDEYINDANEIDQIDNSTLKLSSLKDKETYSSQWLPGPLSYPWALMILGVAEIAHSSFIFL